MVGHGGIGRNAGAPSSSPQQLGERGGPKGVSAFKAETLEDRWILSRFNRVAQEIGEALDAFRFHEAAHVVYHFFWGEYCDWYLELIKPRLLSDNREQARAAYANLISDLRRRAAAAVAVHAVHYRRAGHAAVYDGEPPAEPIALSRYPLADEALINAEAETEMAILQDLIVSVRNVRAELKVEQKAKLPVEIFAEPPFAP